jgi:hypothetical protein
VGGFSDRRNPSHINAVSVDTDGNLLISARHTSTVYKLDRRSGEIIWRLGGKKSDFALGSGLPFWYQHNPIATEPGVVRIFDNESNGIPVLPASRVIWVQEDLVTKTATLVRSIQHPDGLSAPSQGGSQALDNGDTFVGWGAVGRFSEFDPDGNLIFDANVPTGYDTYRAYRFAWEGEPGTKPTASAQLQNGATVVDAIWNGATEVATWDVLDRSHGGSNHDALPAGSPNKASVNGGNDVVASAPWNGLDTTITVNQSLTAVIVVARDSKGQEIGRSPLAAVGQ